MDIGRKIIPLGAIAANCTVLWKDPCQAVIVDPGAEAETVIAFCGEHGLTPAAILLTHAHFDHIGGIPGLLAKWPGVAVHLAPADEAVFTSPLNRWPPEYEAVERPATLVLDLVEGTKLDFGGLAATVLSTPGHTPGSVCFHFAEESLLVSGDTLFAGSCGRTDFPGGDPRQMEISLQRLSQLPPETLVIPGHGMTTTIERERDSNPFLQ